MCYFKTGDKCMCLMCLRKTGQKIVIHYTGYPFKSIYQQMEQTVKNLCVNLYSDVQSY